MVKNIKLFVEIIKEVFYVLSKKAKLRLLYVAFIILISALLELLGVSAILPFVQAVVAPEELMRKTYLGGVFFRLGITDTSKVVIILGVALIVVYLFKNAFIIYSRYIQAEFASSLQKELSVRMLKDYLTRPYEFFLNTNSSIIRRACSNSTNAFYSVIDALLSLITELVAMILIGIYLIYTDWFTAVGTLVLMSLVLVGIVVLFKPTVKKAGNINKEMAYEKSKSLSQVVEGIKDIYVMKRENLFIEAFENASEELRKSTLVYSTLSACPDRITEGVCVGGIIGILCIRILSGDEGMIVFIPKLAAFAMAAFKLLPSVGKIANRINTIVYNRPLQEEVYRNIVETEGKCNRHDTFLKDRNNREISKKFEFKIIYEDVVWKYQNQIEPVFDKMNITINNGESIGFIGPSGAGKTTAADILLGLLKPQSGRVLVNEENIFDIPYKWASMVGYVPQSVFLIDDTIKANVAFGLADIKDEDIWEALERAQLRSFVEQLPERLDTIVGERGVKLSGGQRQRIAIARALYNKPRVLVLDEATAALDNETENAVMESIEALQGTITMVIVAHRLTTIRKCDRVYEIKNGKAEEIDKKLVLEQ